MEEIEEWIKKQILSDMKEKKEKEAAKIRKAAKEKELFLRLKQKYEGN